MTVTVIQVKDRAELERCWAIRLPVFVDEQKVPAEEEIDDLDFDPETTHFLAVNDGVDVGTARMMVEAPGVVYVGRVAVHSFARKLGVGRALMDRIAEEAQAHAVDGVVTLQLSAQEQAMPFYASVGYTVKDGRRYLDAGIWHQDMVRKIQVSA